MMEFKQEQTNEAAAAKKTLESNEEISKEDVEIGRLIEERRTTTQRGVSKQIKNASGTRQEQTDRKRNNEYSKTSKGLRTSHSAKRRVLITKINNEKGEVITSRKTIANVFVEFYKNDTMTKNTKKLNKKTKRMKMKAASMR